MASSFRKFLFHTSKEKNPLHVSAFKRVVLHWGCSLMTEHRLSMYEAMGSNLGIGKQPNKLAP